MKNPWFRLYAEFATDPKVQMLSEQNQRRLVMLFCLRSCNDYVTLHDDEIAFQLRISNEEWEATKAAFIAKGFIDDSNAVLNWNKRQYVSDSSAERVARHRNKKKQECNVTVTPPDTDTDTDTDTEGNSNQPLLDLPGEDASPKAQPKLKNGTRLQDDWKLPKAWGEWALQERPDLTPDQVRKIADQFKDHWIANANRKEGRKADWQSAWRTWVRREKAPAVVSDFKTAAERRNENIDRAVSEFLGGESGQSESVIEGEFAHA